MAERRQRQPSADRRLISDRTAKGLRILAAPQRVYRDHGVRGLTTRRSLNLTDYLAVPPEEMELDDDNDSLESMVDPSGTLEGTRMNSDLYDAYADSGFCAFPPILVILLTRLIPFPTPAQPLPNLISPPVRLTSVMSCAPLHVARTGRSCATPPQMDGPLRLPLRRHTPRRSPVSRPFGASRPGPGPSTLLILHHDVARLDANAITRAQAVMSKRMILQQHRHLRVPCQIRRMYHPAGSSHPAARNHRGVQFPIALLPVP
jgi:hypothetical protein